MKFEIEKSIEILSRTPGTVRSLLAGLSSEWIGPGGDPENWTPFDVVGHLIHGEETDWVERAEIILAQSENRTFKPFDRFAQFEKSKGKTLDELLDTFSELRGRNLQKLKSWELNAEDLSLKGTHPALGEVTLEQLLATWVVHDLNHIKQIAALLAKKYKDNVGAWEEYLSILKN